MESERREALADYLVVRHFDGNGCGTHENNACSVCFGPSPMTANEIAEMLAPLLAEWSEQDRAKGATDLANAWQWGGWAEALLSPSPNGTLATAQAVTDWLRANAAALAPSTPRRAEPGVQGGDGEGCEVCGRPIDWTGQTAPGAPCMGCGRYPAARPDTTTPSSGTSPRESE